VARQREKECTREKVVTGDESNALCTSWAERELQSTEISESFRQQGKKHTISVTATMNKMQPIKPALKYSRGTCAAAFLFFFFFIPKFCSTIIINYQRHVILSAPFFTLDLTVDS